MSKNKCKFAIILAALLLVGGALFAYFYVNAPLKLEEPAEIEIWYAADSACESFDDFVERFNEGEGADAQVSAEVRRFDSEDSLLAEIEKASGGGELPDVILCDIDISACLLDEGRLADVGQYITGIDNLGYDKGLIRACTTDSILMCVPLTFDTEVMLVNSELYGGASKLDSFEELCDVANSYYADNKESFFTITDYSSFFGTAMAQLGEQFTAENPFDSDNENLRYIYDQLATAAFKRGYIASHENAADLVARGELPCAIVPASQVMDSADSIDMSNIEFYPVPAMTDGDSVYTRDIIGLSIIKSDENTEKGAAVFIKWLCSEEMCGEFAASCGYAPTLAAAKAEGDTVPSAVYSELMNVIKALDYKDYDGSYDYALNCREFNDIIDNIMKTSLS